MKMCSITQDTDHLFYIDFVPPIGSTIVTEEGYGGKSFKVVDIVTLATTDNFGGSVSSVSVIVEELAV